MSFQPCVYILTNKRNGTLYIGVTSRLPEHIETHRQEISKGFTSKYKLKRLVYYERHHTIAEAISREKQIKKWKRLWKIGLIEEFNPLWEDLYFFLD